MPKHTSDADRPPIRVVIVTLDGHLSGTAARAAAALKRDVPGLELTLHAASEWGGDPAALERCVADIDRGDIIIAAMLFLEDHVKAVYPSLLARREKCDAMVGCMSAGEVVKLTRMGKFVMGGPQSNAIQLLKRLYGSKKRGGSAGARQMTMLRRLPRVLKYIPGKAQDMRAYFLALQYWLACSDANMINLVRFLVDRYADGPRVGYRGAAAAAAPVEYPEVGLYAPARENNVAERLKDIGQGPKKAKGVIGLLLMRSYVLAGDTRHYDGVVAALEAKGLRVIPAFAFGLDARPAVEKYFKAKDGRPRVDAIVSLTGFSLVGGPAYNDARAAEEMLADLDVPYIAAQAVEFQSLDEWRGSERGLMPVESTMMIAIPELDGATGPMVYGGRAATPAGDTAMLPDVERCAMLAERVSRIVALRRQRTKDRKVAIVLFNFPPGAGNTGSAAHLSVFKSLWNTLKAMREAGYTVSPPADAEALRNAVIEGNAATFGTPANVQSRVSADDHVSREEHLEAIEAQWGPAPGKHLADGASIFVLGAQFGNVFVGVQPGLGYEGDPMRLLFEQGFAPTHAFSAFYRYLREDFAADAVLHFGTHGALEFMPGKQTGLTGACWPDRLIGATPNFYLYAGNNPSEGAIAKRRVAATLISHMTPPACQAGLYRGLTDLKESISRWRKLDPAAARERKRLSNVIQAQAASMDFCGSDPAWTDDADAMIARLWSDVLELETSLIPHGLHVVGEPLSGAERRDYLGAIAETAAAGKISGKALDALVKGATAGKAWALNGKPADGDLRAVFERLAETARHLRTDAETPGILAALDGRFIRPAPGGDLLRTPEMLPAGRNIHGFDPYRIPSAFAAADGAAQAQLMLDRNAADGHMLPETVAMVLWGTDNLKTEGGPIAQALALMGASARFDGFGRLAGAELIPLDALARPRIDVMMTLSGIFRDLLPLQTRLLAEAAFLAASADEPEDMNFIRKHALSYAAAHGVDLETAALRVFSNAEGAYGSNVSHLIENGAWTDEDELAATFTKRKSFAYGRSGRPVRQEALMGSILEDVGLAYQNLDSVEVGVTTIDHYFDTLGGISKSVKRVKGGGVPVYIGDQTQGDAKIRTLAEQVGLETRTRMLNPKWFDAMLEHGYEGVRQIEAHVTNTLGWSATTGQVSEWVYKQLTETYLLDDEIRKKLMELNPAASAKLANRLLEAHERNYWTPDEVTLDALRRAGEELEDKLEGIGVEVAA